MNIQVLRFGIKPEGYSQLNNLVNNDIQNSNTIFVYKTKDGRMGRKVISNGMKSKAYPIYYQYKDSTIHVNNIPVDSNMVESTFGNEDSYLSCEIDNITQNRIDFECEYFIKEEIIEIPNEMPAPAMDYIGLIILAVCLMSLFSVKLKRCLYARSVT